MNIIVNFNQYSKVPRNSSAQRGRRGVIMGLAVSSCLEHILKRINVSNIEDTVEKSLFESGCSKEDMLKIIVDNQNFKDYSSMRSILLKCISHAIETNDYIYFSKCLNCTVLTIK